MGNLLSQTPPLTVSRVLECAKDPGTDAFITSKEDIASMTHSEVAHELIQQGIEVEDDDSIESQRECLEKTQKSRFWSVNYDLHKNSNRVKPWIWVHDRYRTQLTSLIETAQEMDRLKGDELARKANDAWAKFAAFTKKIEAHSDFEDNQLFKFFREEKEANEESLAALNDQHKDILVKKDLNELFNEIASKKKHDSGTIGTLIEKLMKYRDDMLKHLEYEENTLVIRWMNLTDEKYKTYRSYLSWKYCVMY